MNRRTGLVRRVLAGIAVCLLILPAPAFAQGTAGQRQTVRGTVKDTQGNPLVGAAVTVQGTTRGVHTDIRGEFSVQADPHSTLRFSYLGFAEATENIGTRTHIDVILRDAATGVDEIVVIGYGQVKKSDITGSVATVKMEDVRDVPVLSIDQALQGRIAGADFMSTSGAPGATTSIRIRGTRSISASNEPLIVVDGVIDGIHDLNDLNSADIASISVLKDASATAIYGSRGSNGVIIVTTKSGRDGKPRFNLRADVGFSQLPNKLDLMDATDFALYRNEYSYWSTTNENGSIGPGTPLADYPFPDPYGMGKGTDWVDAITRTAPYQNYNISAAGGSQNTQYFASFGYNDQQGLIKDNRVERYTVRLKIDHSWNKWLKMGTNLSYTHRRTDENKAEISATSWWRGALYLAPTLKKDSDYNDFWNNGQKYTSPLAYINYEEYFLQRKTLQGHFYAELKPIEGLSIKSAFTYYVYQRHTFRFRPSYTPGVADDVGAYNNRAEWEDYNLLSENIATYNRTWAEKHNLEVMAGFTGQSKEATSLGLSGTGYLVDEQKWNNMGAINSKDNYSGSSSYSLIKRMSVLFRAHYNYDDRYILTVTGRSDGSSNFAENNKWAFFPSAALRWNLHNEAFMAKAGWLSELGLRVSAGKTGNDAISAYRALASMGSSSSGYLFGENRPVAYYPSRIASPDLTWETTTSYNLAIDFSMFNNRLTGTLEGYLSHTDDLLLQVQRPNHTGYSNRFMNIGKTSNKGVELTLDSRNISTRDFSWSTTLTVSRNKQMVKNIGHEDFVTAYASYSSGYMMYGYVEGYPLNALWGYRYGGVWKSQEEIERNKITKAYVSTAPAQYTPGGGRYYDINGDGSFSSEDIVYLGQADPDLYGGLQNTFKYKGLMLSVYFNYSLGGKIYNISEQWLGMNSATTNKFRYMLDTWHPLRNPDADIPRADLADNVTSDRMVHSATFLRLKNASISYNFDLRRRTRDRLGNLTITASGDNLYLWKKYNGFDPEVSTNSGDSATRRLDVGGYPKPRVVTFSLQLSW